MFQTILSKSVLESEFDRKFDLMRADIPFGEPGDDLIGLFSKLAELAKESSSILAIVGWKDQHRVQSIIGRKTGWALCNCIIKAIPRKGHEAVLWYAPDPSAMKLNPKLLFQKGEVIASRNPAEEQILADRLTLAATDEGDRVLDCFAKSGCFAFSAKSLSREYLGFEPDEKRHAAIASKLEGMAERIALGKEPGELT
jgi:hypothetical protein